MISVVVPAFNAANTISECVESLKNQTLSPSDYEIIVVDNGSSDNTVELAGSAGAKVLSASTKGAAAARNVGLNAAIGNIICFTDADCFPNQDWIYQITSSFTDPNITGCKGVYATRQTKLVARFVQVEYEDKYDLLKKQRYIDFIDTYSAAYRRDVLLSNGGFEERIRYVEDQELSFRLAARGYRMVFQPLAGVYHKHSDTLKAYIIKKFWIAYWKAQVVRRFPTQGVKDSHTPQVMKLQMVLVTLALLSFLSSLLLPEILFLAAFLITAFLLTTLPFLFKAWPKDHTVALTAPFILGVRAAALSAGYAWGILRGLNYLFKRLLDVVTSIVGLLFALIVLPIIFVAIKLTSPGPILFRQQRVGQGGRPFAMYKFRSMDEGAEEELDYLINVDELNEPVFKLDDDPRVTPVGRFLRRWSLDELPQFLNVIKGEMSLIGPRPEESRMVAKYSDWHRRRLAVKPGITGPMQVNGRADLSLDDRVRLELDYIENYSVWRDIVIMAKTLPAIIAGRGAR
jgi:lipopolysaccharide/colanic/teichoic acid biosynthesis glycosyltransferase/glycosyltransferase involved in cell wall biosynthesis